MIVGIDIGTSYSSICILNKEGKAEPVKISTGLAMYGNDVSLPSAVFVDNENVLVGQAAYNSRMKAPENFKNEFKRDFGQEVPYHLGGTQAMPEDLYKELFVHMKTCAEVYTGTSIQFAYITHPARFSEKQKDLLKLSANRAGLLNIALLEEPVAAAYHYVLENNLDDNKTLLVYDFGGGTFDVALVKFLHGEFSLMADPSGIDRCGGIDVDMLIYNHLMESVPAELYDTVKENPKMLQNFKALLTEQSVKAKHHLSSAEVFHTEFVFGFDVISYELNRAQLNKMISPLVDDTLNCVQRLIASASITASDIDVVLLVGGTSRIPLVKEELDNLIKKPVKENVNPELAIALGAVSMGKQNGLSCAFTAFKDANNRFGFQDSSKNQVLPAIYEDAQNFSENRAAVKMNGKWGIIDQNGKVLTPFEYDEIIPFKEGLAKGRIEDKWGFLNRSGEVIIPFKYPFLGEFVDGLCPAKQGELCGYLSADGTERIPLIYTKVHNFSNERARVTRGKKIGYIDARGNEYIPCFFDDIWKFIDGVALVKIDNRYGFIDENGKAKTRFIYHSATEFKDGISFVNIDGKHGVINKNDDTIVPIQFRTISYDNSILLAKDYDDEKCVTKVYSRNGENLKSNVLHINQVLDSLQLHFIDADQSQFKTEKKDYLLRYLGSLFKRKVEISYDFYFSETLITQKQWEIVMKESPSIFKGNNLPIENISWVDATIFCNRLNEMIGLDPFYIGTGNNIRINSNSIGFRLPNVNEWYKAKKDISVYNDNISEWGWYDGNSAGKTHPVSQKKMNGLGIYDMLGNVWEWCDDSKECEVNNKVIIGGSWKSTVDQLKTGKTFYKPKDEKSSDIGIRVVFIP